MNALFHNEDCTNFFAYHDTTDGRGGEEVDRYIDVIADAGATTLLCNTNAQLANYRSDAWQSFWDGFDPDGSDDQPLLASLQGDAVARWRRLITHMMALHEQGVDYPARVIERCRRRGISPWISLRMNDVHNNDEIGHPIHSRFWRENPGLYRRGYEGYFSRAFDFARSEVRAYYWRLIEETLDRYDIDGLELDFLREPYLFSRREEEEGREILTGWIGEIRRRVRQQEEKRGHPIRLGVRVPSKPATSLALGVDPVEWARRELVDLIVVTPRWATLEYDMPIGEWRRLLESCDVILAGGLEILLGPHPTAPKRPVTPEEALGAAAQVLHSGADSVYLFNYFQDSVPPDSWTPELYRQTLRRMASLESIAAHPRRHAVSFCDVTGPEGEPGAAQLPAAGKELSFHLPSGPKPDRGEVQLDIELEETSALPEVAMNGVEVKAIAEGSSLTCRFPADILVEDQQNEIRVTGEIPLTVVSLSIRIAPGE